MGTTPELASELVVLEPTLAPTAEGALEQCTNEAAPAMAAQGRQCETFNNIATFCNRNVYWRRNKFCQKSCWEHGYGYEGDDCSEQVTPSPTTTVAPEPEPLAMESGQPCQPVSATSELTSQPTASSTEPTVEPTLQTSLELLPAP